MKNGVPVQMETEFITQDKYVARIQNGVLTAVGEGETDIRVVLKDCTDIDPQDLFIHIEVGAVDTTFSCYIEGKDKIRLGHIETYVVCSTSGEVIDEVIFSIDYPEYANIVETVDNTTCKI